MNRHRYGLVLPQDSLKEQKCSDLVTDGFLSTLSLVMVEKASYRQGREDHVEQDEGNAKESALV